MKERFGPLHVFTGAARLDRRTKEKLMITQYSYQLHRATEIALRYTKYAVRKVLKPTQINYYGVRLHINRRAFSPTMIDRLYRGIYEREEASILCQTVESGDRILMLGGGIGFTSLIANELLRASEQLLVVEANPELISEIERNFATNGVSIKSISSVVGYEEREKAPFYVHEDFWRSSSSPSIGSREVSVRQVDIRHVLAEFRPTYLMIDIEGDEVNLLQGFELEGVEKICVEVHPERVGLRPTTELVHHLLNIGFYIDFPKCQESVLYFHR